MPTNGYDADVDNVRFELTLSVFTEAYKITGNETYLNISKKAFDSGVKYCFNTTTELFANRLNRFTSKYKSDLDITWAGILLNGLFDFYGTTHNATHLLYAEKYADALLKYAANKTSWLPYGVINVTTGARIGNTANVPLETGRLIGGYIRGYEVTGNQTYVEIAKNLTKGFWDKRNLTTNLWATGFNAYTGIMGSYEEINLDPIQNVLLYAYDRTKDQYFLDVAQKTTDAQIKYGWWNNRMARSIYTSGSFRDKSLDLVDGASLYIGALAQLYYITKDSTYLTYAETYWNTLYNHAKINGLYVKTLDQNNNPDTDISSMYCMQMAVQADALLYHVSHDVRYINDVVSTVNLFWDKYHKTYGTVNEVNANSFEVEVNQASDWLDSSSYVFGSAICFLEWYPNNNEVIGDMFYYVPYYPMFKGISIHIDYGHGNGHVPSSSPLNMKELMGFLVAFACIAICVKALRG
jgi:hypothetical protein